MKKRLFMIIAVITIIAMAVVGLVACIDNNGGANNGGNDNGDNNNGGDNTEVENPITETAGLNINNFRNELATKSLTLKYTENSTISGMSSTKVSILEYEPTKWKQTQVINGKNIVDYLYKLGDKYVRVDADLNVYNNAVNDALAIVTMFIAPNASDLFELKSGKYSVKTDKFVDYYYKIVFDNEVLPSEGEWNFYKLLFESLRIEFMPDSISVSFASRRGIEEAQASFEITKIGSTTVIIPQEILDLPVPGVDETPIIETAGLNINNFCNELGKKNFTLRSEISITNADGTNTENSFLEYEPTKWKETTNIDGNNSTRYLYVLGDKNVLVEADLSIRFIVNDVLSNVIYFVVPNVDLFDLKDGIYIVKKDKFADYYKAMKDDIDASIEDPEFEIYKTVYDSLKIQFKENSISFSYIIQANNESWSYSYEITKIGSTSVVIPQEILDLPVHGLTIDRLSDLRKMSYTANLIVESAGEVVEDSFVKFNYEQDHSCLSSYLKGSNDMIYVWENENKYYIAMQDNDIITKEETVRDNLYGVVEMIENIVGNHYSYFELIDGRYVVSESNIDNYIESLDLQSKYKNDMDAARAHVRSIEFTLGKDIILTYTDSSVGTPETRSLIVNDFYATTTSVPDSIINMPVTNSMI